MCSTESVRNVRQIRAPCSSRSQERRNVRSTASTRSKHSSFCLVSSDGHNSAYLGLRVRSTGSSAAWQDPMANSASFVARRIAQNLSDALIISGTHTIVDARQLRIEQSLK